MGVNRWTRFLAEQGWLPRRRKLSDRSCDCSIHLWRIDNNNNNGSDDGDENNRGGGGRYGNGCQVLSTHIVKIPTDDTNEMLEFHIDGHALVFFLHSVAYARHIAAVCNSSSSSSSSKAGTGNGHALGPGKKRKVNGCYVCADKNAVTAAQVCQLLPQHLPLQLLADVTVEFFEAIAVQHGVQCYVYWDGPMRYMFKQEVKIKNQKQEESKHDDSQLSNVAENENFAEGTGFGKSENLAESKDPIDNEHITESENSRGGPSEIPAENESSLENFPDLESLPRNEKYVAFKQETDDHRRLQREPKWTNLRHYLDYGSVPPAKNYHFHDNPSASNAVCQWEQDFPMSRLCVETVRYELDHHALFAVNNDDDDDDVRNGITVVCAIKQVQCQEEADRIMAAAVTNRSSAYILGNDSDFCFFPNVQYIPFTTLAVPSVETKKEGMTAVVITRAALAEALGLPSEEAIVEVACLLGNDYIFDPKTAQFDGFPGATALHDDDNNKTASVDGDQDDIISKKKKKVSSRKRHKEQFSVQSVLDFVCQQGPDYRVTSPLRDVESALSFCRKLYGLQDLHQFFMSNKSAVGCNGYDEVEGDEGYETGDTVCLLPNNVDSFINNERSRASERFIVGSTSKHALVKGTESARPTIPADLNLKMTLPDDCSVKDAVVRCLQTYVTGDHDGGNLTEEIALKSKLVSNTTRKVITQEHIDAFKQLKVLENAVMPEQQPWRPLWEDVHAAYILEKTISACISQPSRLSSQQKQQSCTIQECRPSKIWNAYNFHAALHRSRMHNKQQQQLTKWDSHGTISSSNFLVPAQLLSSLPPSRQQTHRRTSEGESVGSTNGLLPSVSPFAEEKRQGHRSLQRQGQLLPYSPPVSSLPVDPPAALPIDEHQDKILNAISRNRVTIIQGETGCGKSSRIPVMLLKQKPPPTTPVRMYVSQPRRIAAKALVERVRAVEPQLKDAIALRMGHGVREYESSRTKAWFVTTGYLVRFMANCPDKFNSVSHVIIDEVHERSVDTDILCLLCKRLLLQQPNIRLVLMSATLAAALYQEYFGCPEPPIFVGAKRFPVSEVFLETLTSEYSWPVGFERNIQALLEECDRVKCKKSPSLSYMENLYKVTAQLALQVGRPGSSVLVFVPGMNDILAISEAIEALCVPGLTFTCFPIHSDIPFDDQMHVFDTEYAPDEVRIIIATNAAESSVTLPDVDHVICLGLCKQVVYNELSHRQMLLPCWISRASATQRAGRTGRLRPGTVYRLYTRRCYKTYMLEYEPGEMKRIPLDSVILMLKEMINSKANQFDDDFEAMMTALGEQQGPVTNTLLECLEPPNLSTIGRSFQSLFKSHFISSELDSLDCEITTLGRFVHAVGIDLSLGAMIGLGIQFGVAAEAIQLAAVFSFPKSAWIISNPLIHEPADFNNMTKRSFVSKCHFDANLFSEPLATMNLLHDYQQLLVRSKTKKLQEKDIQNWCCFYAVSATRIRRLMSTANNLRDRVADFLGIETKLLSVDASPCALPHSKITMLRVLQTMVFHETIIECRPRISKHGKPLEDTTLTLSLPVGECICDSQLEQILLPDRHPYTLSINSHLEHVGTFDVTHFINMDGAETGNFKLFLKIITDRFVSYAVEKDFDLVYFWNEDYIAIFCTHEILKEDDKLSNELHELTCSTFVAEKKLKNHRRGVEERPAGMWAVTEEHETDQQNGTMENFNNPNKKYLVRWICDGEKPKSLFTLLDSCIRDSESIRRCIACNLTKNRKIFDSSSAPNGSARFRLTLKGEDCRALSKRDLRDLLATTNVDYIVNEKKLTSKTTITFLESPNIPLEQHPQSEKRSSETEEDSSWKRPLMHPVPEGMRLLSVLASSRRRHHVIRLNSIESDQEDEVQDNDVVSNDCEDGSLDVGLDLSQTRIANRWTRPGTRQSVFMNENSVVASALPTDARTWLYCAAANTMEVRGGGLRAEGLTMLPPGRLFYMLCQVSFGVFERNINYCNQEDLLSYIYDAEAEKEAKHQFVNDCIRELKKKKVRGDNGDKAIMEDWIWRIEMAYDFHKSCANLGDELVCFPDKTRRLLAIFDGVDGYNSSVWDVENNPMTRDNLIKFREFHDNQKSKNRLLRVDETTEAKADVPNLKKALVNLSLAKPAPTPPNDSREKTEEPMYQGMNLPLSPDDKHGAELMMTTTGHFDEKLKQEDNFNSHLETTSISDMSVMFQSVDVETSEMMNISKRLFSIELPPGQKEVQENEMPSTNILALVVGQVRLLQEANNSTTMSMSEWRIRSCFVDGDTYYFAEFWNSGFPLVRHSKREPAWVRPKKQNQARPDSVRDVLDCIPPPFVKETLANLIVFPVNTNENKSSQQDNATVCFKTVDMALRMEAAFWLERQFRTVKRHWYEIDISDMITRLKNECQ